MNETLKLLTTRRSVLARNLREPAPAGTELETILEAGLRVPDHGKLGPWRLILIDGETRARLGEILVQALAGNEPDAPAAKIELTRDTFTRAPLAVAVVSSIKPGKIPEWEQVLSCGAVCMNLLNAVHAAGYAGQWLTEWYSYEPAVQAALELAPEERLAGFIYMGTAVEPPAERVRPAVAERLSRWTPPVS